MKNLSRMVLCLAAALVISPVFAEDAPAKKGKKGEKAKPASAFMMEKLNAIELTDDQKAKLAEVAAEFDASMKSLRDEGLTQELSKKKAEAMKKAREEGKKGKELETEVMASLDVTEEQQALLKKAAEAQAKFQKGMATMLTEEQIATLPEATQQQLNRIKNAGSKKAKKAA
jgi:hypothetical protein